MAPGEKTLEFEWFDKGCDAIDHTVICCEYFRENEVSKILSKPLGAYTYTITGLIPDREYMLYIERNYDHKKSLERRFRTGKTPGIVVNYLHPLDTAYIFSGQYLASPSVVRLESGAMLASMDVFAAGTPQNLSFLFRSDDNGNNWNYITDLCPCFWGKLFVHKGILYMLAVSTELGDLIIGSSNDEGYTWSAPVTLFKAGRCPSCNMVKGFHKAPTPVISHAGRLWAGIEFGGCHCMNDDTLLSVSENEDLLNPQSWICSEFMAYDEGWEGAAKGHCHCCIEGNAVAGPDGEIYNFLRYQINDCIPNHGKALVLKGDIRNPEKRLEFERFVDFNSAHSKFDIIQDPVTKQYISIASKVINNDTPHQRNVLVALVSIDLIVWREAAILLDFSNMPVNEVGFQYIDFIIVNDDILYLSRTAFNHAHSFHDSNYITFHKIINFRKTFNLE